MASFDFEKAAKIVVDSEIMGVPAAAKKHEVSERTVWRHRKRAESDADLAELVGKKARAVMGPVAGLRDELEWRDSAREALKEALEKLREIIKEAGTHQMRDVVGAIKILGDLDIVKGTLDGEQSGATGEGETASEASGGAAFPSNVRRLPV